MIVRRIARQIDGNEPCLTLVTCAMQYEEWKATVVGMLPNEVAQSLAEMATSDIFLVRSRCMG
jgi:hypothetical protein